MRTYNVIENNHFNKTPKEIIFSLGNGLEKENARGLSARNNLLKIDLAESGLVSEREILQIINNISSEMQVKKTKEISVIEEKVQNDNQKLQNELLLEDKEKGLKYVVAKEKKLLDQYYSLRNEIFQKDRGWTNSTWFECEFDRRGDIILAVDENDNVVGGARLMTSTNGELLSGELKGTEYLYRNLFKKIGVDENKNYGEIDGLIVIKANRDRSVTEKLLKCCIKKSLDVGCSYMVGIAHPAYCRIYRSVYRSLGFEVKILNDVLWFEADDYNYSKDHPMFSDISAGANLLL